MENPTAERAWSLLQDIREKRPLVQCITNYVSMDFMANSLLAFGASPAMVHAQEEVADFAEIADALLVNVGTLTPLWVDSMKLAISHFNSQKKPWVLDPVGCGATEYRTKQCMELLSLRPAFIRGNASEILALAGASNDRTRGVDSTIDEKSGLINARLAARNLAREYKCVVAISGAEDFITTGMDMKYVAVDNGVPMLQAITATGCSVTAICASCIAVALKKAVGLDEEEVRNIVALAAGYGMAIFGLGAELAIDGGAKGPGTLRSALLDTLYMMQKNNVLGIGNDGAVLSSDKQCAKGVRLALKTIDI